MQYEIGNAISEEILQETHQQIQSTRKPIYWYRALSTINELLVPDNSPISEQARLVMHILGPNLAERIEEIEHRLLEARRNWIQKGIDRFFSPFPKIQRATKGFSDTLAFPGTYDYTFFSSGLDFGVYYSQIVDFARPLRKWDHNPTESIADLEREVLEEATNTHAARVTRDLQQYGEELGFESQPVTERIILLRNSGIQVGRYFSRPILNSGGVRRSLNQLGSQLNEMPLAEDLRKLDSSQVANLAGVY